jgi:hypothetical protein
MKPLLITDCDEVLLHMVRHFAPWLDETHDIEFTPDGGDFSTSMRHRADGRPVEPATMWGLLDGFFPAEMARQTLVPHAREALQALSQVAEIVVLTNLGDHCREHRVAQLATHGIAHRVECNQGGKGAPVARIAAEFGNPVTVFVDDLPMHHATVAKHAPDVWRVHMIAEPRVAAAVPKAEGAHTRIDDWPTAADWILDRFKEVK